MEQQKRDSFVFFFEWSHTLREFSPKVRLAVYDAITEYAETGELPEGLDDLPKMAFMFIKKAIDRNNEKYSEFRQKQQDLAKRRWNGKKPSADPKKDPEECHGIKTDAMASSGDAKACHGIDENAKAYLAHEKNAMASSGDATAYHGNAKNAIKENVNVNVNIAQSDDCVSLTAASDAPEASSEASTQPPKPENPDGEGEPGGAREAAEPDYEAVREYYNRRLRETGSVMAPARYRLGEDRRAAIRARLREYGRDNPGVVREVIDRAVASDFLNGRNDRSWRADLGWLLGPKNFEKVLEGRYDNAPRPSARLPAAGMRPGQVIHGGQEAEIADRIDHPEDSGKPEN